MLNPMVPRELDDRPWLPLFRRLEGLASAAFQTIPVAGPSIARLFDDGVVPACTPVRDAVLRRLWKGIKGVEGAAAMLILRLLPLPPPLRPPRRES